MKILFVNLSALKFTVKTPDHTPLGGSESALCYLARSLSQRGHKISLIANLPSGQQGAFDNIDHYPVEMLKETAFFASEKFDVIIVCNAPNACAPLKMLSPGSRIIFWAHALPDQPAMQALSLEQTKAAIDTTIFVSSWQRSEIERVFGTFRESFVIGNGIAPSFENMFTSPEELLKAKQNRAAYTATPYRGLSVLLKALERFDRPVAIELFSSMRVYQASDDDYIKMLAHAAQNPTITCHGSVAQNELAKNLRNCAFLFYPSIYPETFCITAAEAMAAGMKIISTQLGALEETTMGFADLVAITSSDGDVLANTFCDAMRHAVDTFAKNPNIWAVEMFDQVQRVNKTFTWSLRAVDWEQKLQSFL